jgi:diguanylate cyclase (GGDEF)-like protein
MVIHAADSNIGFVKSPQLQRQHFGEPGISANRFSLNPGQDIFSNTSASIGKESHPVVRSQPRFTGLFFGANPRVQHHEDTFTTASGQMQQLFEALLNCTTEQQRSEMADALRTQLEKLKAGFQGTLKVVDELETENVRDIRTGLFNVKHFEAEFPKLWDKAQEAKQPLTMITLDLDFFKNVNDVNGHPVGDRVLEEVGKVLQRCCRTTDLAFRNGGEEFVLLLPNTQQQDGLKVAQRILESIPQITQNARKHPRPNDILNKLAQRRDISASIGVLTADFSKDTNLDRKEVFHWADETSYQAKKNGRNQIYTYHPKNTNDSQAPENFELAMKGPELLGMGPIKNTGRQHPVIRWIIHFLKEE